ncbi:transmembrane protein 205 [Thrips palmi]|uniref:Transmembrane protein 205 n=1 Tax=Thrips palmi TaxID=161013 RepID=A0A6P9A607_THRPL|nr:transmembrane protein 205 [Thrips palmi]
MEAADADDRHPSDMAVPLVGRQPSSEEIAAARARLVQRLAARSAAANKKTVPAASSTPGAAPEQDLDLLASATAKFSVLLGRLGDALEAAQQSHYYSVLSRTTQPAHLVAFVSVALVAALLFPRHADSATSPSTSGGRDAASPGPAPWTYLAYVVAFAAHFGSQFWMTFVSGLSLFFSLPRHHFAAVQKVLFPLYFAINAALSLVTLSAFVRLQPSASRWDAEVAVQVGGMVLCFLLELLVRLYLTPPLLHLITAKTEMERTVEGVGEEVGRYDLGPLTQCPHYVRIHRAFRKVHTTIAMANIAAMACTALHAHYLAGKICV